jgi:hypothetical protein
MEKSKPIDRPYLTFPTEVGDFVTEEYAKAETILEYGSGGSTVLASEMPGKSVFSVESDKQWAFNIAAYLEECSQTLSLPKVHYVDIGPTKAWGHPVNESAWRRFHHYPLEIWQDKDLGNPTIVLIDGRFRAACFFATCMSIDAPTRILFDDYSHREHYHVVENIIKPTKLVGRMAVFDAQPGLVGRNEMLIAFNSFVSTA